MPGSCTQAGMSLLAALRSKLGLRNKFCDTHFLHSAVDDEVLVMEAFPMTDAKISVLVADDHQLVRNMVATFLASQEDYLVRETETYDGVFSILTEDNPFDIVLLDVQMPGMEGIRCFERLVNNFPETSFVVFSGAVSAQYVQQALNVGAKGYIPKTLPFKSLLSTVSLIAAGEVFVPSFFTMDDKSDHVSSKFELTDIELGVLRMLCAGMSNKEIANEIDKTEVLVKMYMRGICRKLGAKNRTQAAIIALREEIA